jgi:hypothetical protein
MAFVGDMSIRHIRIPCLILIRLRSVSLRDGEVAAGRRNPGGGDGRAGREHFHARTRKGQAGPGGRGVLGKFETVLSQTSDAPLGKFQ